MVKKFHKNLIAALTAQTVSVGMSVLISLVLPKLLGVEGFAYWQMFILYSGYVGLFHFGLSDGLYLRYGGTNLADMDKRLIGSQFRLMILWQIAISAAALLATAVVPDSSRRFVWAMTAVYLVPANALWGMGLLFQAANETRIYSAAVILSKALMGACILVLLCTDIQDFRYFILCFAAAQGIAAIFCLHHGRSFLRAKWIWGKELFREVFHNAAIGIRLTAANVAGSLLLGIGRMFTDHRWGISAFGVLSLAVSLVNLVLQFLSQVAMVLFPQLRQTEAADRTRLYHALDGSLGILLGGGLLLYAPARFFLSVWLPEYAGALSLLGILLPICVLDGKMQLLYGTYFKVLRLEGRLLRINALSCLLCLGLCCLFSMRSASAESVAYAMLVSAGVRNLLSGRVLGRIMQQRRSTAALWELLLCAGFVVLNRLLDANLAALLYGACWLPLFLHHRKMLTAPARRDVN